MSISVIIFYFIIVTTGATLHVAGHYEVQTAQDAAAALRPLAGNSATVLFSLGILGTGLLGVSVLAGSSALAVAEAFDWRAGMSERLKYAKPFYAIMIGSVVAGAAIIPFGPAPMRLLFFAAMLNGLLAPPLIVAVLIICNNKEVMGKWVNPLWLNVLGIVTALVMASAAIALLVL
jgi:Mn2+/Fe2+ NRAMP family transporter